MLIYTCCLTNLFEEIEMPSTVYESDLLLGGVYVYRDRQDKAEYPPLKLKSIIKTRRGTSIQLVNKEHKMEFVLTLPVKNLYLVAYF